jgi:hypothetical protein
MNHSTKLNTEPTIRRLLGCIAIGLFLFASTQTLVAADSRGRQKTASVAKSELVKLIQTARRGAEFVRPKPTSLRAAEQLFEKTMQSQADFQSLKKSWAERHWMLESFDVDSTEAWLIREHPDHRYGRGMFLIRPQATTSLCLQAPHSFYDTHTGTIVAGLATSRHVKAVAWNTVHRKRHDWSHSNESFLKAFTRAFARSVPNGLIVQVHGFAGGKRRTAAGRQADVIVSNRHARHNSTTVFYFWSRLSRPVDCLRRFPGQRLKVYLRCRVLWDRLERHQRRVRLGRRSLKLKTGF